MSFAAVAVGAVAAGATAYSASKAAGAQNKATKVAQSEAEIARQLFEEAQPLRRQTNEELLNFVAGGTLPVGLRTGFDAVRTSGREGIENQYRVARENILNTAPVRGGQLNDALINLETNRAGQVGTLDANLLAQYELPLRASLFGRASEVGLGQTNNALTGLSGAGSNLQGIANTQAAQAGQYGQSAGALLALALKQKQAQQQAQTYGGPQSGSGGFFYP